MLGRRKKVWLLLLLVALSFRLFIALRFPNDTPDDGRVYAQIARNVLEQHVYSHEEQPPYTPSLIRLPGYPLFLAAIYSITGHGNNTAVRIVEAFIDTGTCLLIALVAFAWTSDPQRKTKAALSAFALAAVCPFTTIYVATILTEVPTSFLAVGLSLLTTLALQSKSESKSRLYWILAGLVAGLAVFFRPDSGLFAAAVGLTILLSVLILKRPFSRAVLAAAIFSFSFCLVLVPWTIRNRRVFGVFQPLSPAHGEMPGEFVPRGYLMWLRTWLDDGRYIGPVLWRLDTSKIPIEAFPKRAFDSQEERDRVAVLLAKYNHEEGAVAGAQAGMPGLPAATPQGSQPSQATQSPQSSPKNQSSPSDVSGDEEGNEEGDEESDDEPEEDVGDDEQSDVEMTPEIDAAFAQLARERIARAPLRYYVVMPVKRASSLWFDTHSQYYPFDGNLLPLENLDYEHHQQYWLPLFVALTWIYTLLGVVGGWFLWRAKTGYGRLWLVLAGLTIFLRLGFFSSLENPEPRYVVELFPFLAILGGIALSHLIPSRKQESNSALDRA
jgi:hypothetical protein